MSRYVDKKHGLYIGSGNTFFVRDSNPEPRYYNAIVGIKGYKIIDGMFDRILTSAEQLIWEQSGKHYMLTPWARLWCNTHVKGKWEHSDQITSRVDCTLFFEKRSDALAFCAIVDETLKGLEFSW